MRFLILTLYFPPEVAAAAIRLRALAEELEKEGHEVSVITALPNYPAGRIFDDYRGLLFRDEASTKGFVRRVWLYAATGRGAQRALNYLTFCASSLLGGLGCRKYDYVLVNSPPFLLGITGWILAKVRRAKMIFYVADLWPDSIAELGMIRRESITFRLLEGIERWIYKRATLVNAATVGIERRLLEEKTVPMRKVQLFMNGVNVHLFTPEGARHQAKACHVFLYAGVHGYAQGLEVILKAAWRLRGRRDIEFWLIGDGPTKADLMAEADRSRLDNVRFIAAQPPERMPEYFRSARASLVPLRDRPLFADARPSKLQPSWGCGVPVIFCGRGESAELIEAHRLGWVVPPDDDAALAAGIEYVAGHPDEAEAAGARGRQWVVEHHSWEKIVGNWLARLEGKKAQA